MSRDGCRRLASWIAALKRVTSACHCQAYLRPPPSAADGLDSRPSPSAVSHHRFDGSGMNGFGKKLRSHVGAAPNFAAIIAPTPDRRGFRQPSEADHAAGASLRSARRRPRSQSLGQKDSMLKRTSRKSRGRSGIPKAISRFAVLSRSSTLSHLSKNIATCKRPPFLSDRLRLWHDVPYATTLRRRSRQTVSQNCR